jgi:hypothetical protein
MINAVRFPIIRLSWSKNILVKHLPPPKKIHLCHAYTPDTFCCLAAPRNRRKSPGSGANNHQRYTPRCGDVASGGECERAVAGHGPACRVQLCHHGRRRRLPARISLAVAVTGFNIHEEVRFVAARTQRVDFAVRENPTEIREVIVRAPAVTRRRDTLTYTVAKYADVTDRSIGDVLRKMPGIEVAKSGEVKYNGKAINKFYIEGLDMLEGRYGIATNNVRAPRSRSTRTTSRSRRSRTSSPRTKRP